MQARWVNACALCCRCAINVEDKKQLLRVNRHVSPKNTAAGVGDVRLDDELCNTAAVQNAAESSDSYKNNGDSRDAHRRNVTHGAKDSDDVKLAAFAERNPRDGCRIKKSVSFRADPKPLSNNAAGDERAVNRMYRSLPRPHRQQRSQQRPSKVVPVPTTFQPLCNTSGSDGDWRLSAENVVRDHNEGQDSSSRPSQWKSYGERSTCASGLLTQRDTGVVNSIGGWSSIEHPADDKQPCPAADHLPCRPTLINLTDSANTEFRPPTSLAARSVDRLRNQGDNRTGAVSKPSPDADENKLEPETSKKTTWSDSSDRRGRATTRALDQVRKATEMRHLDRPSTANRTSKNPDGEDHVFHRSSISPFRRSTMMTKPKNADVFIHAGSSAQPTESRVSCRQTRTRSVSLSERYRMLIGGDWFDKFAANQQTPTQVNGPCKPLALSRELKPDFVIYV